MRPVYVVVVLQDVSFPASVEIFPTLEEATTFANNARIQYENNRVYVYEGYL